MTQSMQSKKKVVVIGGGNGASITLRALKMHADMCDIAAVISMSDSGGSSGRLREELDVLPPGDIMRAILALSRYDHAMLREIFYERRFSMPGKLEKHNLGNLFLALSARHAGDFLQSVRALEQALGSIGHAYPATLEQTTLCVLLSNGDVVFGEANIDVPAYDRSLRIRRVWLEPAGVASPEAIAAIVAADAILFGPGDLYTSIIPAILPSGMQEAIAISHAQLIPIVGGTIHAHGETGPASMSDWAKELQTHLPRRFDAIVYNTAVLNGEQEAAYRKNDWALLEKDMETLTEHTKIGAPFTADDGGLSPAQLGAVLRAFIFS